VYMQQEHPKSEIQNLEFKIQNFCAYQERSIKDVKDKLTKLKANKSDIPKIISQLQKDGFLNEERYAKTFVLGKFKHNNWGRIKIRYELLKKQIPQSIISKALYEIDEDEYLTILNKLISKKLKALKPMNKSTSEPMNKFTNEPINKIFRFLISKGFESNLISKSLKLPLD
jgi:regulatory protein